MEFKHLWINGCDMPRYIILENHDFVSADDEHYQELIVIDLENNPYNYIREECSIELNNSHGYTYLHTNTGNHHLAMWGFSNNLESLLDKINEVNNRRKNPDPLLFI